MRIQLVKLDQFSGEQASVYSIIYDEDDITLFEKFIIENKNSFLSELKNISIRLRTIGTKTGARETFFKPNEGKPGDLVCALYDEPKSKLRLYCIRYGTTLIIIGGGGPKLKSIRSLQEDSKLMEENQIMRTISELILKKIKDKSLSFSEDYYDFEGDLDFLSTDYE
jgi:hypothetical protein